MKVTLPYGEVEVIFCWDVVHEFYYLKIEGPSTSKHFIRAMRSTNMPRIDKLYFLETNVNRFTREFSLHDFSEPMQEILLSLSVNKPTGDVELVYDSSLSWECGLDLEPV